MVVSIYFNLHLVDVLRLDFWYNRSMKSAKEIYESTVENAKQILNGGYGSGNWGHAGRPGMVGGSSARGGADGVSAGARITKTKQGGTSAQLHGKSLILRNDTGRQIVYHLSNKEMSLIKTHNIKFEIGSKKMQQSQTKASFNNRTNTITYNDFRTSDKIDKHALYHEIGHAFDYNTQEKRMITHTYRDGSTKTAMRHQLLTKTDIETTRAVYRDRKAIASRRILDTMHKWGGEKAGYSTSLEDAIETSRTGKYKWTVTDGNRSETFEHKLQPAWLKYAKSGEEIFGEGYAIYRTDPKFAEYAPNLAKVYNNLEIK